jgi:hypothetical protein
MALSRVATKIAAEIRDQDWSDAHSRLDGARHNRDLDHTSEPQLKPMQAESVRMNVVWVVAQALAEEDPNFSVREFAKASGVPDDYLLTRRGTPNGGIEAGLRPVGRDIYLQTDGVTWMAVNRAADPSAQPTPVAVAVASSPAAAIALLS